MLKLEHPPKLFNIVNKTKKQNKKTPKYHCLVPFLIFHRNPACKEKPKGWAWREAGKLLLSEKK